MNKLTALNSNFKYKWKVKEKKKDIKMCKTSLTKVTNKTLNKTSVQHQFLENLLSISRFFNLKLTSINIKKLYLLLEVSITNF